MEQQQQHIVVLNSDGTYSALHTKDASGQTVQIFPMVVQSDRELGHAEDDTLFERSSNGRFELSAEGKVELLRSGNLTTFGPHMYEALNNERNEEYCASSSYGADYVRLSRDIASKGDYNSDDEETGFDYPDSDDEEEEGGDGYFMRAEGKLSDDERAPASGNRRRGGRRFRGGRGRRRGRRGRGGHWWGRRRGLPRGFGWRARPGWRRYWYPPYGWVWGAPGIAPGLGLGLGGLALGGLLGSLAQKKHHGSAQIMHSAGILPLTPYVPSTMIDVADQLFPGPLVHIHEDMPNLDNLSDLPEITAGNKQELLHELRQLRLAHVDERCKGYEIVPNLDCANYEWACCSDSQQNIKPIIEAAAKKLSASAPSSSSDALLSNAQLHF